MLSFRRFNAQLFLARCSAARRIPPLETLAFPRISNYTSTLSAFGTLAPPLMGYLIQQGGFELNEVLLWTVSSFYAVSAVFFFFVGESIKRDRNLKEA